MVIAMDHRGMTDQAHNLFHNLLGLLEVSATPHNQRDDSWINGGHSARLAREPPGVILL